MKIFKLFTITLFIIFSSLTSITYAESVKFDASTYEGEVKKGKAHGVGIFTFSDGSTYEGKVKSNKIHGKGKYTDAQGKVYEGKFKYGAFIIKIDKKTRDVIKLKAKTGIEVGAGYEILGNTAGTITEDGEIVTGYVKYAMGGLTASYQESYANTAHSQTTEGADKASSMMGVAYTMGDLTVSYGMSDLETHAVSDTAALITVELESIQAAYTMGAMTVSVAMSETDNVAGISAAAYSENTLAVSFAF